MLRPRFHLSTLISASVVTGVLIWANVPSRKKIVAVWGNGVTVLGYQLKYGWPLRAVWCTDGTPQSLLQDLGKDAYLKTLNNSEVEVSLMGSPTRYGRYYSPLGICVDALVFVIVIVCNFIILEKLANRPRS